MQIESGDAFVKFYGKIKSAIQSYSSEKPSKYFGEKLAEMPEIKSQEIDEIINSKDGSPVGLSKNIGMLSMLVIAISTLFGMAKRELNYNVSDKLKHLQSIIDNLIYMLDHPGFEELYYAKKSNESNQRQ